MISKSESRTFPGCAWPSPTIVRQRSHRSSTPQASCLIEFSLVVLLALVCGGDVRADAREFEMTIEDTRITLVDKQDFHTFAFNGQVPGPLIHVKEGDDVSVKVMNLTSLPHTIHWHGLLQRGTWQNDGVPGVSQEADRKSVV